MNLEECVTETLQDLLTSIEAGNKNNRGITFKMPSEIKFDLAVTATQEDIINGKVQAKAGIKVLGVNADIEAIKKNGDQVISRVQFTVPVQRPLNWSTIG